MPAALISLKREKKKQCEGGAKKKKTREAEENGRAFRAIIEAGDYPVRSNCFGGGGGGDGPRCSPAVWCRVRGRAGLVGKQPSVFFFCLSKSKRKTETRIAIGQVLAVGRSARKDGGNHLRNVEGPIDRGTGPHSGITAR